MSFDDASYTGLTSGEVEPFGDTWGAGEVDGPVALNTLKPSWFPEVTVQAYKLLNLKRGWDTYGAPPVDRRALTFAFEVLRSLMREDTPVPQLVATAEGGVQLEWHLPTSYLELEFTAGRIAALYEAPDEEWEKGFTSDLSGLASVFEKLSNR